jgi:hypothetical protein
VIIALSAAAALISITGDTCAEQTAAATAGAMNCPRIGSGVIRRLGSGPLHGPMRGGLAIRIPSGEQAFREGTEDGPTGARSDNGDEETALVTSH